MKTSAIVSWALALGVAGLVYTRRVTVADLRAQATALEARAQKGEDIDPKTFSDLAAQLEKRSGEDTETQATATHVAALKGLAVAADLRRKASGTAPGGTAPGGTPGGVPAPTDTTLQAYQLLFAAQSEVVSGDLALRNRDPAVYLAAAAPFAAAPAGSKEAIYRDALYKYAALIDNLQQLYASSKLATNPAPYIRALYTQYADRAFLTGGKAPELLEFAVPSAEDFLQMDTYDKDNYTERAWAKIESQLTDPQRAKFLSPREQVLYRYARFRHLLRRYVDASSAGNTADPGTYMAAKDITLDLMRSFDPDPNAPDIRELRDNNAIAAFGPDRLPRRGPAP